MLMPIKRENLLDLPSTARQISDLDQGFLEQHEPAQESKEHVM